MKTAIIRAHLENANADREAEARGQGRSERRAASRALLNLLRDKTSPPTKGNLDPFGSRNHEHAAGMTEKEPAHPLGKGIIDDATGVLFRAYGMASIAHTALQ